MALATVTRLGAGDARYRVGGPPGPVDTVFPGTFRRAALDAAGGFDETLLRNEDYELNWRLCARGGTVWFAPELVADYRPRGSFAALARQYYDYGLLEARRAAPPSALAQGAPARAVAAAPALAASVLLAAAGGLLAAGWPAPGAEAAGHGLLALAALCPGAWAVALFGVSAAAGLRRRRPEAVLMPAVLATIHLAWAAGFLAGARPVRPDAPAKRTATGAGRAPAGGGKEGV